MAKPKIIKRTSEDRRVHETGAQRDMNEKKGRMDLVPAVAIHQIADFTTMLSKKPDAFRDQVLNSSIAQFWNNAFGAMYDWLEGKRDLTIWDFLGESAWNVMQVMSLEETGKAWFPNPLKEFSNGKRYDMIYPNWLRRVSVHYQSGGEAHGFRNWEKGMPVMWMWDSATRHLYNWMEKEPDEDHLAAHGWNVCSIMHTIEMVNRGNLPESVIEDIPASYMKKS